ncbi:MAG: sigma-70 family RNA polymerase sigma factor [Chitinophagaceae bacterium]|nr:sigma-70 family RNA polymerase sigma factor [Chitinophagaceae bacterium]
MEDKICEIVHTHSLRLLSTAFNITRDKPVAEDIVQEAFLQLWQKRDIVVPDNLGGWLHRVVSNAAYKHVKRESKRAAVVHHFQATLPPGTNIEDRLSHKENARLLHKALRDLPERQRLVYELNRLHGMNRYQIAAYLRISPNTVKVHLQRAVQFIREYIAHVCLSLFFFFIHTFFFPDGNTNPAPKDLSKERYPSSINYYSQYDEASIQNCQK